MHPAIAEVFPGFTAGTFSNILPCRSVSGEKKKAQVLLPVLNVLHLVPVLVVDLIYCLRARAKGSRLPDKVLGYVICRVYFNLCPGSEAIRNLQMCGVSENLGFVPKSTS